MMMNKTVIGLKLEYFLRALIAVILSFVSLLIPYTSKDAGRKNMITTSLALLSNDHAAGISFFLYLAVILTVISLVFGVISYFKTGVKIVKVWMYIQILATFFWTTLLFATKTFNLSLCQVFGLI